MENGFFFKKSIFLVQKIYFFNNNFVKIYVVKCNKYMINQTEYDDENL